MFTPHWAGVVGFMVFSCRGNRFSELLPPGGQDRLHVYSPLGSGFTLVTTHWVINNIKRSKNYQGKAK